MISKMRDRQVDTPKSPHTMGKPQIVARAFIFTQIILDLPHFSRSEQKHVVARQITTAAETAMTEFYSSINNMTIA
jgi:hypothetical protein